MEKKIYKVDITDSFWDAIFHFENSLETFVLEDKEISKFYWEKFSLKNQPKTIRLRMLLNGELKVISQESNGDSTTKTLSLKDIENRSKNGVQEYLKDCSNIWNIPNSLFLFFYYYQSSIKKVFVKNSDSDIDLVNLWYTQYSFESEESRLCPLDFDMIIVILK